MRKYILVVPKFGSRISGIMEDVCFPSLFFQFSLNQCLTYIMEKEKKKPCCQDTEFTHSPSLLGESLPTSHLSYMASPHSPGHLPALNPSSF